jgi:hypothetical protein
VTLERDHDARNSRRNPNMTTYTVRNCEDLAAIQTCDDLTAAIDALTAERLAHDVHPQTGSSGPLELVVTADEQADIPGDVIVHYAAGRTAS